MEAAAAFNHVRDRRHRDNPIKFFTIAEVAECLAVKRSFPTMIEKRILRKRQVLERLGIRKTTLYDCFIKTGRLRFVKIGARAVGIIEDELDALIEELRRERDQRPRAACERQDANPDDALQS
jgi:predicted DNA-binding transcriptional regulator AlpA